jgi:hypothetical protein
VLKATHPSPASTKSRVPGQVENDAGRDHHAGAHDVRAPPQFNAQDQISATRQNDMGLVSRAWRTGAVD